MDVRNLLGVRLLIVTGKGGVGKSTAAAALALAGARTGRRTCLIEVEGRQIFSRLFDTSPWGFDEREFRPGLWGLSIDPEASLQEYLAMFYGARRLSRLVASTPAVEFATQAAPGIKDVLLVGKVKEMETRRDPDGRHHYDLLVLDAPPTGRIVSFLRAPDATTQLVNVGPIRHQAQTVIDMLTDADRTRVQLVTLLEEMPVQETVESVDALHELGVSVGAVLVNRVAAPRFDDEVAKLVAGDLDGDDLSATFAAAGLDLDAASTEGLLELGRAHLSRIELQDRMRAELRARLDLPTLELPYVYGEEFGAAEVDVVADVIEEALEP